MNILFLTLTHISDINEQGIYTDLIREFNSHGHSVHVIHPIEKRNNLNASFKRNSEIKILSVNIGNITKTNMLEKGISTLTLQKKYKKSIKENLAEVSFDLILYSTPPITFVEVIKYLKKKSGTTTYLMLKDIFPQNAVDLKIIYKINPLYWFFRFKEKKLYEISDFIGCMSEKNIKYLKFNNRFKGTKTIELLPNSISPIDTSTQIEDIIKIRKQYDLPFDKKIFIYGGNLGKPQGIDFIIECLIENEKNDKSFILITGSGTEYVKLNSYFEKYIPKNSKLINYLEKSKYELLARSCDVGLVFLDRRFTIPNFPSRILSYMQARLPVLAATDINTDIGEVILDGNFGYWCESTNSKKFNHLINKMSIDDNLFQMGNNGLQYLLKNYTAKKSYDTIMKNFD